MTLRVGDGVSRPLDFAGKFAASGEVYALFGVLVPRRTPGQRFASWCALKL